MMTSSIAINWWGNPISGVHFSSRRSLATLHCTVYGRRQGRPSRRACNPTGNCCDQAAVVVSSDDKYGNKQVTCDFYCRGSTITCSPTLGSLRSYGSLERRLLLCVAVKCSYDFAFVDAEKRMYQEYFELLLQLVRVGGVIVIDNVLWHGKVADPLINDVRTTSIRSFNITLMEDNRVNISMVPIGDGMTICRKR